MEKLTENFGRLIAYVLPGAVVAFSLQDIFSELKPLFSISASAASITGAVLVSLLFGMVINGLSGITYRPLFSLGIYKPIEQKEIAALQDSQIERYRIIRETFNYFEAYGNLGLAFFILGLTQIAFHLSEPMSGFRIGIIIFTSILCFGVSYSNYTYFIVRMRHLLTDDISEERAMCKPDGLPSTVQPHRVPPKPPGDKAGVKKDNSK